MSWKKQSDLATYYWSADHPRLRICVDIFFSDAIPRKCAIPGIAGACDFRNDTFEVFISDLYPDETFFLTIKTGSLALGHRFEMNRELVTFIRPPSDRHGEGGASKMAALPSFGAENRPEETQYYDKEQNRRNVSVGGSARSDSVESSGTSGRETTRIEIFKSKTRLPARLVSKKAVIGLGYPFEEEGVTIIIQKALSPENIDEVIRLSEAYKTSESEYSRPNTPSMTNGSSRSNSSSIITCETCGNSGNHCACTSCSDSDTVRVLNPEEWTRSPHSSPALLARKGKGKLSHQGSRFRLLGPRLPCPKLPSKTPTTLFPESDHCLKADSEISISPRVEPSGQQQCQSSHPLKHTIIPHFDNDRGTVVSRNTMEGQTSDSEAEDDEDESDDVDEGDEDDDWSGQDGNLEAIILKAVGDDLPLAAYLIPILHRSLHSKFAINAKEKLGSWRYGVIKSAQGSGAGDEQTSARDTTDQRNNPRKRQRRQGSTKQNKKSEDLDEEEDDDDDEPQDFRGLEGDTGTEGQQPLPRLACLFHKRDPSKYSIQHGEVEGTSKAEYRTCAGPGFKSIQRLKEHLKRKHYPVQCDRCYCIFPGSDRAVCVLELQNHRQSDDRCERRSPSGKEGISEAQWANLDKTKSNKKSPVSSRIALWMGYWAILFPGIPQPATPWYDNRILRRIPQPTSEDARRFEELFNSMLNLKVNQQYIRFLEGEEDTMKTRVENLAYQAFSIYLGLNGSPSTTNSSSIRSGQQSSLLGGSFQHLSTPTTSRGQISLSGSRSMVAQTHAYSNVSSSPPAILMASRSLSQGHPSTMGPPAMAMPRMSSQSFTSGTMQSLMSNEQPAHDSFPSSMAGNLDDFAADPFANNSLGAAGSPWHMDYNTDADFYANHRAPNLNSAYVGLSQSPLDSNLLAPSEESSRNLPDLHGFGQYQNTGNMRYDRTQQ